MRKLDLRYSIQGIGLLRPGSYVMIQMPKNDHKRILSLWSIDKKYEDVQVTKSDFSLILQMFGEDSITHLTNHSFTVTGLQYVPSTILLCTLIKSAVYPGPHNASHLLDNSYSLRLAYADSIIEAVHSNTFDVFNKTNLDLVTEYNDKSASILFTITREGESVAEVVLNGFSGRILVNNTPSDEPYSNSASLENVLLETLEICRDS